MKLLRSPIPMQVGRAFRLLLAAGLLAGLAVTVAPTPEPDAYLAEIQRARQQRQQSFRGPFSRLALVHREYLKESARLTIGSAAEADLRLTGEGIAPLHAVLESAGSEPRLKAIGNALLRAVNNSTGRFTELPLRDGTSFRIGRFNLLYKLNPLWGPTLEVFDPDHPAVRGFRGLDFFPIDSAYRVEAEVVPYATPQQLNLIDSQGNEQPHWLYSELRFTLNGTPCRLELYTLTLDPDEIARHGFMLIFADATSGRETYPAARYLYVEGKLTGRIQVDFNQAFNPPCNFSAVFTCPFPRSQNRLPMAIRAGEKWYRGLSVSTAAERPPAQ